MCDITSANIPYYGIWLYGLESSEGPQPSRRLPASAVSPLPPQQCWASWVQSASVTLGHRVGHVSWGSLRSTAPVPAEHRQGGKQEPATPLTTGSSYFCNHFEKLIAKTGSLPLSLPTVLFFSLSYVGVRPPTQEGKDWLGRKGTGQNHCRDHTRPPMASGLGTGVFLHGTKYPFIYQMGKIEKIERYYYCRHPCGNLVY